MARPSPTSVERRVVRKSRAQRSKPLPSDGASRKQLAACLLRFAPDVATLAHVRALTPPTHELLYRRLQCAVVSASARASIFFTSPSPRLTSTRGFRLER
jgi:hypothetical protein